MAMSSRSLRRLAAEHSTLHTSPLPPCYLLPPHSSDVDCCANLTTLSLLLTGPAGTPYATGVFRLRLAFPATYPRDPPAAYFETKIFHPNVDPESGAVCLGLLKKDVEGGWTESVDLRQVLGTIRDLLVAPNGESALNGEAGRLLSAAGGWSEFERRAHVWSGLYAGCPRGVDRQMLDEARRRGEDAQDTEPDEEDGKADAIIRERVGAEVNASRKRSRWKDMQVQEDGSEPIAPEPRRRTLRRRTPFSIERDAVGRRLVEHASGAPPATPTAPAGTPTPSTLAGNVALPSGAPHSTRLRSNRHITPLPACSTTRSCRSRTPATRTPRHLKTPSASSKRHIISNWAWTWSPELLANRKGEQARTRVSESRRKVDEKRWEAVGGNVALWNQGAWGVRRGLHRL